MSFTGAILTTHGRKSSGWCPKLSLEHANQENDDINDVLFDCYI